MKLSRSIGRASVLLLAAHVLTGCQSFEIPVAEAPHLGRGTVVRTLDGEQVRLADQYSVDLVSRWDLVLSCAEPRCEQVEAIPKADADDARSRGLKYAPKALSGPVAAGFYENQLFLDGSSGRLTVGASSLAALTITQRSRERIIGGTIGGVLGAATVAALAALVASSRFDLGAGMR